MRERPERLLKLVCLTLAALLVFEVVRIVLHANPLAHVTVPALPSLAQESSADGTESNSTPVQASPEKNIHKPDSASKTNLAMATTNSITTNAAMTKETNSSLRSRFGDAKTNTVPPHILATTTTQSVHLPKILSVRLAGGARLAHARKKASLPPDVQARVERITDSEILGPVIRPLPMALLGIAGNVAFLRAPNGQTGLVKAGDQLGDIKLLRIGTNRVLIEEDGKQKELTIFEGLGGQSLSEKKPETAQKTAHENAND